MEAFHSGAASTLVATDIAARGIHVDDVALVVHADPPVEHKAYLHRSGRTARAGAAGTVITLMTDEQVRDVRDLTRAAGIKPTTTKITGSVHPVLAELAPGERVMVPGGLVLEVPGQTPGSGGGWAVAVDATARAAAVAVAATAPARSAPAGSFVGRQRWRQRQRSGQGAVRRRGPQSRSRPQRLGGRVQRQPQRRGVQRTPLTQASGRHPRR